jgi:hypothetical protein
MGPDIIVVNEQPPFLNILTTSNYAIYTSPLLDFMYFITVNIGRPKKRREQL